MSLHIGFDIGIVPNERKLILTFSVRAFLNLIACLLQFLTFGK
jgi:hypothetical protein